jgi:hypothetical protein
MQSRNGAEKRLHAKTQRGMQRKYKEYFAPFVLSFAALGENKNIPE